MFTDHRGGGVSSLVKTLCIYEGIVIDVSTQSNRPQTVKVILDVCTKHIVHNN